MVIQRLDGILLSLFYILINKIINYQVFSSKGYLFNKDNKILIIKIQVQ